MLSIRHSKVANFKFLAKPLSSKANVDVSIVKELEYDQLASVPFLGAKIGPFFQEQPSVGNQYLEDSALRSYLKRWMPANVLSEINPDLQQFGKRVATDIWQLHLECDKNLPKLEHYNAWGKRVDNIVTCSAWKKMKDISAEEGLIAIGYQRKFAEWSRLYQIAKLYLYSPSAGLYTCPLAMTDGAARSLELLGTDARMRQAFSHLTSRDPAQFWTSGQWMTERRGGSDVAGGTETLAMRQSDGSFSLHGYKWFTSATDSNMALTLARIVDDKGSTVAGTKGLTMFYVEVRDAQGNLNNIQVQRLKDKLGTRQVPTAELLLTGSKAYQVAEASRGVANITHMLLMTRLYNAMSSVASMRRITNLARDYSKRRECFGHQLHNYPVHIQNLANMEIETRSALLLTMEVARLLGREECGVATAIEKDLLRILTPLAKLYTAKQAVAVASEGLESFGGQGYMEDTGLPAFLRDAQVLPIWEGTTNILSLDVLRAISKSGGQILESMRADVQKRLGILSTHAELGPYADKVRASLDKTCAFARRHTETLDIAARDFALSLARTYMGMLVLEHAVWKEATPMDVHTAVRWCERDLVPVLTNHSLGHYSKAAKQANYNLVFDGYGSG